MNWELASAGPARSMSPDAAEVAIVLVVVPLLVLLPALLVWLARADRAQRQRFGDFALGMLVVLAMPYFVQWVLNPTAIWVAELINR